MAHVSIGPEFFEKARNDYSNWHWALVREFFQNSIDCGSNNITVTISEDDKGTTVVVSNDGRPMDKTELVDKLLSLGSSGKDFEGTVGGFGKAKELLYFCWNSYTIESGNLKVQGSGAEYTLTTVKRSFKGTRSTIRIGERVGELAEAARDFVRLSKVKPVFTINGEEVRQGLRKGYYRRDLPFGKVYTNRQAQNLVVVRIGGIPMHTLYTKYDGCVVVELDGVSSDVLTSNRDSLRWQQRSLLEGFIGDLTTNKNKALKQRVTEYLRYAGDRVRCVGFANQAARTVKTPRPVEERGPALGLLTQTDGAGYNSGDQVVERLFEPLDPPSDPDEKARLIAQAFIIKNETGRKVKAQYRPDDPRFGKYAYRVIMIWTKLLIRMHEIFGWEDDFTVGFIFTDNESIAEFEQTKEYGKVYYINPVTIDGGTWNKRYNYSKNKARADLNQLAITALHELAHGMGFHDHDEDYANKLTDMAGKLLGHSKDLINCYRK